MITAAILNAILALGVIVMVVAPLVWAILTQHRDYARQAATPGVPVRRPRPQPGRPTPRPSYQPVTEA